MQTLASPLLAIIRLGSCHNVWCLRYSWQRCSVQYQWASSVPPPSNISMSNHARARDSPAVVSIQCWKWSQDSAQCQSIQLFVPDWCLLDSVTVSVAALIMAASFIGHIQTNIASTPCINSYNNNHCTACTGLVSTASPTSRFCQFPWEIILLVLCMQRVSSFACLLMWSVKV